MKTPERHSDLHADFLVPQQDTQNGLTEYSTYPKLRYETMGEKGEYSVIQRMKQFIPEEKLIGFGIENLLELSEQDYDQILTQVVNQRFDVAGASIFEHWDMIAPENIFERIRNIAERYPKNWGLNILKHSADIKEGQANLLLGLEGGFEFVDPNQSIVQQMKKLLDLDIRSFILQYGKHADKENPLCGPDGLTAQGREAVKYLLTQGAVVDLAHVSPKARTMIFGISEEIGATERVAYTHGAPDYAIVENSDFAHIAETRGLTPAEYKRLFDGKGIFGLAFAQPFTKNIPHSAEVLHQIFQDHPDAPNHVVFGLDFGGVPSQWLHEGFEDIDMLGNLAFQLEKHGFKEQDIQKLYLENVREWLKRGKVGEEMPQNLQEV